MGNELVAKNKINDVNSLLLQSKRMMEKCLPKHLTVERMMMVALSSIRNNSTLMKCDSKSLVASILEGAQLGLEINPILGQAYLVPFYNSKKGCHEATMIPGYKGLIALARRSGELSTIHAKIIYDKEHYKLQYGFEMTLEHRPLPPAERGNDFIGAYAVAKLKDGSIHCEFMYKDEIIAIRGRSAAYRGKGKPSGPWVTDTDEMIKKTVIRRLAKFLPLCPELQIAVSQEDMKEASFAKTGSFDIEIEEVPEETPTGKLAKKLGEKLPGEVRPEKKEILTEDTTTSYSQLTETERQSVLKKFGINNFDSATPKQKENVEFEADCILTSKVPN